MNQTSVSTWSANWAWSLPLIVVTVVIHAFCLGLLNQRVSFALSGSGKNRISGRLSVVVIIGGTALGATILHGFEGAIWAVAYRLLGALPDLKSAMLYSLNAITSYGHTNLRLESHWQLMGSLESLNGWILFGLTTAFLFTVVQKVWPHINQST